METSTPLSPPLPAHYDPPIGTTIQQAAVRMAAMADNLQLPVHCKFNDIELSIPPGGDPQAVVDSYQSITSARHKAYLESPEYKKMQEEWAARDAQKKATLAGALLAAPEDISIRPGKEEEWKAYVETNSKDGYSKGAVDYAVLWARLMEARISAGDKLSSCAEEASHIADVEGITGFMYGCAVSTLANFWVYGESLRQWHNTDSQIGNEGEEANRDGGVLNPALLVLS